MFSIRLLLSSICLLLASLPSLAQLYPIQVVTQLRPPYTLNVPAWYSGTSEKLVVNITSQDLSQNLDVRLRLSIRGVSNNVLISSREDAFYPTLQLIGGEPRHLSMEELAIYFHPDNLNFSGLNKAAYLNSYTLPEGHYMICFEAILIKTGQAIGRGQCAYAYLSQNDPPFLNMPRKGESVIHRDPANIVFQWTPRHMMDPNLAFNTEYEFTMIELTDNGMNPEAAFAIAMPFYRTTVSTSTLLWGAMEPPLMPGKRYAWRVQVKAADGTNLSTFKNHGFSEVYWFNYQNDCPPPLNIEADVLSTAVRITWTPAISSNINAQGGTYHIDYRPVDYDRDVWSTEKSSTNRATLHPLDADRTYEYRIGRSCDDNLTFVYSDIKRFKTLAETTTGGCDDEEDDDSDPITSQEPIQTLHPGDIIKSAGGSMSTRIVQVSGQGRFTGYGYATMPLFGHAQFKVKFAGIVVNVDKQLLEGTIESTYDVNEGQIADLDKVMEGGKTVAVSDLALSNTIAYTLPFTLSDTDVIEISESTQTGAETATITNTNATPVKLSIKSADGSTKEVQLANLPTTVKDASDTVYKVEKGKDGKAVLTKMGRLEKSRPNTMLASSIKAKVAFKNYPEKQRYAFDEYQSTYHKSLLYRPKYEALADGYFVSQKAIVAGQTDVIKAVLNSQNKSIIADSVRFVNNQGLRFPSKIIAANTFEVSITAAQAGAQELYAVYPLEGKTVSIGKLLITSYSTQQRKVVLVPVNGAKVNREAISEQLNSIYNPIGVQFDVTEEPSFEDNSWDLNKDGKLAVKGSSLFATLTSEMKALNQAYSSSRSLQSDAIYLFVLSSADESIAGDMPRGKQFGYLFTGDDGKVAAHEIGHGLFKLKHSFDGYGFSKGELANNLMDYPAGDQLTKYQWDQIHDPGLVIGVFERDEDAQVHLGTEYYIAPNGYPVRIPDAEVKQFIVSTGAINSIYPNGALYGYKNAQGVTYLAKILNGKFWGYENQQTKEVISRSGLLDRNAKTVKAFVIEEQGDGCKFKLYTVDYKIPVATKDVKKSLDIEGLAKTNFQIKNRCESKNITLFVNGYRFGGAIENPDSDNILAANDRHRYWEGVDHQFVNRLKPGTTLYADGHHSIKTSNHKEMLHFYNSARSSIGTIPTSFNEGVMKYGSLAAMFAPYVPYQASAGIEIMTADDRPAGTKLNIVPNEAGFHQRRMSGKIAGNALLADLISQKIQVRRDAKNNIIDTLDIVAHSMGYAYALGMTDALKGKIPFGRFYVIAPENACSGDVDLDAFEEVWQYGSNLGEPNEDPLKHQDGVAPQCAVRGLEKPQKNRGRAFIPKEEPKGFLQSHSIGNYKWIFRRKFDETGYIKSRS